ncbi:MAG: bifunctional folylpolyglutamate synthase/dihydrofolate synthase [Acidobacteriota bacterium]
MEFSESVEYLYGLGHEVLAMKLGLETIRLLSRELGSPHEAFPAIHIAGTNGKGSTAAMTEAILRAAGYRTGLYTSPHLLSITERMRVDGEPIPQDQFARLATQVRMAGERLVEQGQLPAPPTFFEQVTAVGYLWYAEQRVDLAVLEVGMGGRLDATNICRPVVTAITPVGLDHQQYLGETIAAIAGEKAGIIKAGIPVVVAPQEPPAHAVILARAAECDAPVVEGHVTAELVRRTVDLRQWVEFQSALGSFDACLSLRGDHQRVNAATAVAVIETLVSQGWAVGTDAITTGLEQTFWPGRLDLRSGPAGRPLIIDGAHNQAGAAVLRDFLVDYCADRPLTLIFGAMRDKDVAEMTSQLFPIFKTIVLTGIDNPRALDPAEISTAANVERAPDIAAALELAAQMTPRTGLIVVAGSLYLVGEVLEVLG